jgi:purine/pyrimidine-nucleoside phosphorylase
MPAEPRHATGMQFANVTAIAKANIYFDGNVVSHGLLFPDGSKKTLGLIYPGSYHFTTEKAERMEIISGSCHVKIDGQSEMRNFTEGSTFDVPANSGFRIEVLEGICEYVCTFLG